MMPRTLEAGDSARLPSRLFPGHCCSGLCKSDTGIRRNEFAVLPTHDAAHSLPELTATTEYADLVNAIRLRLADTSAFIFASRASIPKKQRPVQIPVYAFAHDTEDGRFVSELFALTSGKWVGQHWGCEIQGKRVTESMTATVIYLTESFEQMQEGPFHRRVRPDGDVLRFLSKMKECGQRPVRSNPQNG
jgi:hypothetical protein